MILPWLQEKWTRIIALGEHLPHALLFSGPPGVGKRALAEALAASLLCDAPATDGEACGHCQTCGWRLASNHPDLFLLVPENAASTGETELEDNSSTKAKSAQILIEQVRELQASLTVTGHHGSRRIVIVDPAEAMNVFTANALLKLLEEPPEGCVFLLVSSHPRRLLPTIRSRCQQWSFSRPTQTELDGWLNTHALDPALVAICGGAPLAAQRLAEQNGGAFLERFVADLARLSDPLPLAVQWESWLKSKDAVAAGFTLSQLTGWMQRWVADLFTLRLGGRVRFFPSQYDMLHSLAAKTRIDQVCACYNEISRICRVANHPLNLRLVLEDMLLRYARLTQGARG